MDGADFAIFSFRLYDVDRVFFFVFLLLEFPFSGHDTLGAGIWASSVPPLMTADVLLEQREAADRRCLEK